ncbi:MAG: ABC transporter permease subunit [Nitrospinae bacterium]|nr:ABC transporter permease subunit [Nitrospinota bacterium]
MSEGQVSDANDKESRRPGRTRNLSARQSVRIIDKFATNVITIGGLFVILAVLGIMAFLVAVALPLFAGETITGSGVFRVAAPKSALLSVEVDDYNTIAVLVSEDGVLTPVHASTGKTLRPLKLDFGGTRASAFGRTLKGGNVAFGFPDGTVRFGKISFRTQVLPAERVPKGLTNIDERDFTDGKVVFSKIPGEQMRKIWVEAVVKEPQEVAPQGTAIVKLDYKVGGTPERPSISFATVDAKGVARLSLTETRVNLLTGQTTSSVESVVLPDLPPGTRIVDILLTEKADKVYIGVEKGFLLRYDTRNFDAIALVEKSDLLPMDEKLTMFKALIGEESIVVGGSKGSLSIFFQARRPGAATTDGLVMVRGHELERHAASVSGFSTSQRSRMFTTMDSGGNIWLRHATSESTLLRFKMQDMAGPRRFIRLAPRDDAIVATDGKGVVNFWKFEAEHPETTFQTLFGKVWYESYPKPEYTWQSSSGDDAFEEKISLIPLIFGTIKGTVYSLIFAIPIAVLGAIFTSEFIGPAVRSVVKPAMEMMASLPSVVLGFVAALILAPVVETWIAAVLLTFMLIPLLLLLSAYLWQVMPPRVSLPLSGFPKLALVFFVIILGSLLGYMIGPGFERLLFGGDFKAWANGNIGIATPMLFIIFYPMAFLIIAFTAERFLGYEWRQKLRQMAHSRAALFELLRWTGMLVAAGLLSWVTAVALTALGLDARGGIIDTYVQRNSLVVGFAMGFAVIPIIYTIAEDALSSVPSHLKAASLACGATPWQTALWVILPTAASGIFAAVMIGMGRAVGETMIVVMAAGNTPILDWNVFSGLRALSANIAVELPEAVKDGTLYRVLFLAALVLFGMTFVVNTIAELVRLRFRKRAAQL